ncbi:MAG: hypothetical protein ACOCVR_03550, partial [Myxococcota bacterium]
ALMVGIGTTLSIIGIAGTALLATMIFLAVAASGDPQGIVDGLIRLTWFAPAIWLLGIALEVKGAKGRFRGVFQLHTPLLVGLILASIAVLGWRNIGREIVLEPETDSPRQQLLRSRGQEAYSEGAIPVLGGLGSWAHEKLPPHPLPISSHRPPGS